MLKVLGLFSSYWVQLLALFVLQRSVNRLMRNGMPRPMQITQH